jgi:hypothetical protein
MYVSRSDARTQDKVRRKRRIRRLVTITLILLALIAIIATIIALSNGGLFSSSSGKQNGSAADPAVNDSGAKQPDKASNGDPQGLTPDGQSTDGTQAADGGNADSDGSGTLPDEASDGTNGTDGTKTGGNNGIGGDDPDAQGGSGKDSETVRLAFVGDILLAGSVDELMRKQGYDFPYAKALPFLQGADLTAGNLETPITTRGIPAQDKQFVFKGRPDAMPALKEAGFDVISLANNHTLDQGTQGLLDTIGHLDEAGIPNIGGGNDEDEAFKPLILEAKGISVAYLGFSRVLPDGSWKAGKDKAGVAESYDSTRAVAAIKKARESADLVVAYIHWGVEKADYPNTTQKRLAREYIDAGADLVIGSHPHVLQGFEQYKGKWIAYSLGNFIFNMTKTEKTWDTGVLDASCSRSGDCSLQFHPMKSVSSQPALLEREAGQALIKRISGLSINASIDKDGHVAAK